ncbi:MAG: T9SS type A sorting domain-containing protein [Muribaculaceae bacterium]
MKKFLLSLSIALATIGTANAQYKSDVSGIKLKSESAYAGMITAEDYVRHHATTFDAEGNAFVSTAFSSTLNGIEPIGVSAMVIKLNENGAQAWSAPIVGAATVKDLLSDGNGGVYAAGVFADEVEFRGTDGESTTIDGYMEEGAYTTSQAASFIAHYDADGKLLKLNKVVPTHDPNLDATFMYYPVDGDIYCTISKLMKDGDKLYAKFDYCGKVTADENSATSGSMDMEGWGFYFQAMKAAGVAEVSDELGLKNIVVNMYTNKFTELYSLQEVFSSTATMKNGHLYVGAIGNGDVNVVTATGAETLSFELSEAGLNFGYIVADFDLNDPTKSQIKSFIGATEDSFVATSMSNMYFAGDLLMIAGNFQGKLGFNNDITAKGSSDIYAAALNPADLSVVAAKASGYDEGDKTKFEEIFTSSAVCGDKLFINGYTSDKTDHILAAPLCYIYDMTTGTLSDVANGGYIFGTAVNEAGNMLLNAWSLDLTFSCFTRYEVTSGGVSDAIGKLDVKVYPNPVADVLHFSEAADVELTSLSGAKVAAAKDVTSLDVNGLAQGVYVAKVTTATGTRTVKIVKNK